MIKIGRILGAFVLLAAVIVLSRGVTEDMKEQMRKRSADREEHNLSVFMDHVITDTKSLFENTAEKISGTVEEKAPVLKEKAEQAFDAAPDVLKSYVEHQADFIGETVDRVRNTETEKEEEPAAPEGCEITGPYKVAWATDGDTFAIYTDPGALTDKDNLDENGNEYEYVYVRLIGVDTPESKASASYTLKSGKINTDEGKQASDFTKKLLKDTGMKVWLESDVSDTDMYGRLLRYAYINIDGELRMLNELLVDNGMARLMTIEPNVRYADLFLKKERIAQEEKKGFWDGFFAEE